MLALFGWLFMIAAWLQPHHFRPWLNFYSEALALASVGLLALHHVVDRKSQGLFSTPKIFYVLLALSTLPWLYYFGGIGFYAGDALLCSLFILGLAFASLLGFNYSQNESPASENLTAFFDVLCAVALISSGIGIVQFLGISDQIGMMYVSTASIGDRALGNMGQPNQLATLLLMGISALAWNYEKRRLGGLATSVAIAFVTLALVLTQSRTAIVSGCVIAVWGAWKVSSHCTRLRPFHLVLWLVAYLSALQVLPWISDLLLIVETRNISLTRDNGRIIMWQQMAAGLQQSPWFGFGWNQTPTAHAAGSLAYPGRLTFTNAHNMFVDLIGWTGIPVGLALSAACIYWLTRRMWSINNVTPIFAMAGFLPIFIHSMLEYPFAYAYFLVAAGFYIGIIEADTASSLSLRLPRWAGVAILTPLFVLGGCIIYEYMLIEEDFRIVRFENMRIGSTPPEYKHPEHLWLLSHEIGMLQHARQHARRGMSDDELESLRKATLRFPYGSLGLRYVVALGINGKPEEASHHMQVIKGMFGAFYYRACVESLRSMQAEQYPELAAVLTP
jgi:hypothetical protein